MSELVKRHPKYGYLTADIPEANLKEILTATRTHKVLVEACRGAVELLEEEAGDVGLFEHNVNPHSGDDCVLCQLRKALNIVDGKEEEESSEQESIVGEKVIL